MIPPIVSIVGSKKSGKTTLVERLVAELTRRGYRVGTIKHDVHGFEVDHEGKDSYRHFHAGARATIIASEEKLALVKRLETPLSLDELVHMYLDDADIIITEGFKSRDKPKIEVYRKKHNPELICGRGDNVLAIASDEATEAPVPVLNLNDIHQIADFVESLFLPRR